MNNENLEQQPDSDDVFAKIAEIEAEADLKARQEESQIKSPAKTSVKKSHAPKPARHKKAPKEDQPKEEQPAPAEGFKKKRSKKPLFASIGVLVGIVIVAGWFMPASRFAALNAAGVRGEIVVVGGDIAPVDGNRLTAIKNFSVQMNGQTFVSGGADRIKISDQPFGNHQVTITKTGYATSQKEVAVDFDPFFGLTGAAAIKEVSAQLIATGTKLNFAAREWAGNQPLSDGEFLYGDMTVRPNKNGQVTLTVPPTEEKAVAIKAVFDGGQYAEKSFDLPLDGSLKEVHFVPAAKHYFISKRSGALSVWSSYIDGSDAKEVIRGTDQETQSIQFQVSPSGKFAALVSTREGRRDETGALVQKLYRVDLSTATTEEVDNGYDIRLFSWSGDTIIYSTSRKERGVFTGQFIRSLETSTKLQYELAATSGSFGEVHLANNSVVFTQTDANGASSGKGQVLKKTGIKGENATELATQVEQLKQIDFTRFGYLSASSKEWNELNLATNHIKKISPLAGGDAAFLSMVNSAQDRIIVDQTGDTPLLMVQSKDGKKRQLVAQAGIDNPIRFLNDSTIVYRIALDGEVADYAVSLRGGEARKIVDVTASLLR